MTISTCVGRRAALSAALVVAMATPMNGDDKAATKPGKGLRIFHIGNSLTDHAYAMHDIVKGKGHTDVVWGRFMIPGAPIRHLWSNPGGGWTDVTGANIKGKASQILQENKWDALVLQLFPQNGDTAQTMTESGGNFAEAAYKGNPECQVYVFGSYPGQENFGKYAETVAKYDAMAVEGAKGISKRSPKRKPVRVIPVAQGFQAIGEKMGGVANLYKDDIHANSEGKYLEALIHFATIYQQDPHGAITSGLYSWEGSYSVSAGFAAKAQDVAWDVVRKHPLSGVSGPIPGTPAMELGSNFWNIGWHKPSDCFTNWQNVQGDHPWNPQFLKDIAIFKSLRFMDWDETNNSPRSRWTERNRKENHKQNPVAYEWMIDLCDRMSADLWVTLPHKTVNRNTGDEPCDYALRLCILVKTGVDMKGVDLKPFLESLAKMNAEDLVKAGGQKTCEPLKANLKLYVEYSNETWNGVFQQSHYCCDDGTALGLDKNRWTAGFRFHAWAALRLFRAADLAFGADSKRVIRVLATHTANSWIAGQHLDVVKNPKYNPWQVKADAIATAPYFGHDVQGDAADAVARMRAAIRRSAEDSAKHKKLADAAGLALIAYEGGQHCTRLTAVLNRNPAMHDLYTEYLREMARYFSVFSHYCHVGQAGDGGAWGSMETTGQPVAQAHKYRALVEFAKGEAVEPKPREGSATEAKPSPDGKLSVELPASTIVTLYSGKLKPIGSAPAASTSNRDSAGSRPSTQGSTTGLSSRQSKPPMIIDDFESYKPGEALPWHKAPHGNQVKIEIGPSISGKGRQSMKLTYTTQPGPAKKYVAIMWYRKFGLSGYNALSFWIKPDGHGHTVGLTLNMLDDQGRQHWNLWNASFDKLRTQVGETQARRVIVPFSSLKQDLRYSPNKDVSNVFKPANVTEIVFLPGLWHGQESYGESVLYIDDVEAVFIDAPAKQETPKDNPKK